MMKYACLLILFLLPVAFLKASDKTPDAKPGVYITFNEISTVDFQGSTATTQDNHPIQIGAFRSKSNAEALVVDARAHLTNDVTMIFEEGYYKVRITGIPRLKENNVKATFTGQFVIQPVDSAVVPGILADSILVQAYVPPATDSSISDKIEEAKAAVNHILFLKGDSPWLRKVSFNGKSFAFVNALIIAIGLCIAMMIGLLIFILLNRNRMEREERLRQYLMESYQGLIIDYLFGNASPDEFRAIASNTYRRQVLIDQMIDVSVNLKGDEGLKLVSLYKHLGLDRDSMKRAHDHRWHKKIKGFRELAFMNITDANDTMIKALNSTNQILRMEAQIALVRLSDGNPFEFLSHLKSPFSLWEQITLHELIILHNIPLPSFQQWLNSENPTVVMFALRMIREFKQTEAEEMVRHTIMHSDPDIRFLAVQVAGDMKLDTTIETMKHMYKTQPYKICLEIIKSLGKMAEVSMMEFLKEVLDAEDDVQMQIEATKAIENIGEEGVKALVKLMKSEYKNYNIIIRHVLDRRIY